jgi:hypothetical protein
MEFKEKYESVIEFMGLMLIQHFTKVYRLLKDLPWGKYGDCSILLNLVLFSWALGVR